MDRDRRLTGWLRGQVDRPIAPAGFEYSNGWRVRAQPRPDMLQVRRGKGLTYNNTGREELALDTLQCHQLLRPRPSSSLYIFSPALNHATNTAFPNTNFVLKQSGCDHLP